MRYGGVEREEETLKVLKIFPDCLREFEGEDRAIFNEINSPTNS